jgi:hypothetical protein
MRRGARVRPGDHFYHYALAHERFPPVLGDLTGRPAGVRVCIQSFSVAVQLHLKL